MSKPTPAGYRPSKAPQMPATRDDIPTLDEIKAAQGPLIDAIKSGWRRPCRCGPGMCADSVSCPKAAR